MFTTALSIRLQDACFAERCWDCLPVVPAVEGPLLPAVSAGPGGPLATSVRHVHQGHTAAPGNSETAARVHTGTLCTWITLHFLKSCHRHIFEFNFVQNSQAAVTRCNFNGTFSMLWAPDHSERLLMPSFALLSSVFLVVPKSSK